MISKKISNSISREQLLDLYSNDLLSCEEIGKRLGVHKATISRLIREWNIQRDQAAFNHARAMKTASSKAQTHQVLTPEQIAELRDLYLNQNMSYEEVKAYFQITGWTLDKILHENNIHKNRQISARAGLATKYAQAGSKEQYFRQVAKKKEQTCIKNYGTLENYHQNVSEKCAMAWSKKSPESEDLRIQKLRDSYLSDPDKVQAAKQRRLETNLQRYGVDNSYKLSNYVSNSQPNKDFAARLDLLGVEYQSEFFIPAQDVAGRGFRYDFKIGNVVLEIDPWPFHNSTYTPIKDRPPLDKNYHQQKSQVAKNLGYRCIHVFDWDDKSKIIQSLQGKTKLSARKGQLKPVSAEETAEFLTRYHFQGSCKGQTIRLGLYYQDQLIQLMTFGKPRYNKKYQWELLRLCTNPSYLVVGGSDRLFCHFVRQYQPQSIISYCDLSKFSGEVYSKLGMSSLRRANPSRHWYHPELQIHTTDNLLRQRGFDQLYGQIFGVFGKGTSNQQLMRDHGFVEIYDCGQETFVWTAGNLPV